MANWSSRLLEWSKAHAPLALVIWLSVLFQIYFFVNSEPNQFPDSGVYLQAAAALRGFDWNYTHFAYRTPGYPGFLAFGQLLFGEKGFVGIMGLQFLLGVGVPPMLYALFRRLTTMRWVAAAGALGFYLDRYGVGMQTVLLTEWLSSWSVLMALGVYLYALDRRSLKWAVVSGLVFGLNILIRPSFSFLPFALLLGTVGVTALYPSLRPSLRGLLVWNAVVVGCAYLATLPWRLFLWSKFGSPALTFIAGIALSNHVGPIMERAPDSHREIRDLYLQLRPAPDPKNPVNYMDTGWGVAWEYERRCGRSHVEAAEKLRAASIAVILRNPRYYLKNLAEGWHRIWTEVPVYITDMTDPYMTPAGIRITAFARNVALTGIASGIYINLDLQYWRSEFLTGATPWILLSLGGLLTYLWRRDPRRVITIWVLLGTVFYHVLVHILGNHTEYGRYRLPVQPIWLPFVVFVVVLGLAQAVRWFRTETASVEGNFRGPDRYQDRGDSVDSTGVTVSGVAGSRPVASTNRPKRSRSRR
jgi:4-amino-4-deoxy-L-arabinose transferase-like glycosyltransferase